MKDRIQRIIARENLTASKFADIIGVQRSSVSHILSGRNNPGLDFLNKILQHFPHISGDWLITGQGSMIKMLGLAKSGSLFDNVESNKKEKKTDTPQEEHPPLENNNESLSLKVADADNGGSDVIKESSPKNYDLPQAPKSNNEIVIEKVLVFYSNKTFKEYSPSLD
ncbi:MAG: helix-turn-helix transcriptional regulator [Breznakibacter sp.]